MQKHLQIIPRSKAKTIGCVRYFTGKPCKRGHVSERVTSDGHCIACAKIHCARYEAKNPQRGALRTRKWYRDNTEKRRQYNRNYQISKKDELNKKRAKKRRKNWKNPDYIAERVCRGFIHRLVKMGIQKRDKTYSLLGYSTNDFIARIESTFTEGMRWDNHGEWHVDHKISISKLVSKGITDPAIINSLDNLQALWATDNLKKSNKH